MKQTFYRGLCYVSPTGESFSDEGFLWGGEMIEVGNVFEKIGSKGRSSIELVDAKLRYCGRIGHELFFSIVKQDFESKDENCFLSILYVDNKTMLVHSSKNGFWDIRY